MMGVALALVPCACSEEVPSEISFQPQRDYPGPVFEATDETIAVRPPPNPERNAYFGDLHVHTSYSFDAFAFGTTATPSDAYRYARGEAIAHPGGFDVQLRAPLDFYAVTDHAMFLGVVKAAADTTSDFSRTALAQPLHDLNAPGNMGYLSLPGRVRAFAGFLPKAVTAVQTGEVDREAVLDITRAAWLDTVDAAEQFNEPGRFTTFVAYEYTSSTDERGNLHRNVIFKDGDRIPAVPFSRFHSQNPEGLWDWMDTLRAQGIESLAIPHNSNGSNGQMFKLVDWAGDPLDDAYGKRRRRNEPLVEITQVKGTSETHPALSPNDEWADFEIMPYRVATLAPSDPPGSYARDALLRGLALEAQGVVNPYDFGFVGASDTHTGAISDDESNFFSKVGLLDSTPELRGSVPMSFLFGMAVRFGAPDMLAEVDGRSYLHSATPTYGASGLTGVWAEANTRDAIYAAFRRRETFATSGPRIRLRLFAGRGYDAEMLEAPDAIARADAGGVPMGGELSSDDASAPQFVVWALADPVSAPLQRLQIVKGWVEDGETHERIYDIACSDGLAPSPDTRRCPDNGARVDLSDCSISDDVGAAQLEAFWQDPDFAPDQRSFYYARALENPTCRWSTWDAIRTGVEPRSDLPKTLQERAWSSPVSHVPAQAASTQTVRQPDP
jgi:hypothetical protein